MANNDSTIEKLETNFHKVNDMWAQHNLGTRITLVTFILAYVSAVVATYFKPDIPAYVVDTTGWLLFAAFMTVTLGINGVKEVGNIIVAVKTGKVAEKKDDEYENR